MTDHEHLLSCLVDLVVRGDVAYNRASRWRAFITAEGCALTRLGYAYLATYRKDLKAAAQKTLTLETTNWSSTS